MRKRTGDLAAGTGLRYRLAVAETRIIHAPETLETILGSCVAAVFWHEPSRTGAMCHAALPVYPMNPGRGTDLTLGLRYVDYSMRYMLRGLRSIGIDQRELQLKLFGGANVLGPPMAENTIGAKNCEAARRVAEEESLRIVSADLGGGLGRVIRFNAETGEVLLRRLRSENPEVDREIRLQEALVRGWR